MIEDLFGNTEGMEIRRLTPFMFHLLTKYPTHFNSEVNATNLYWKYRIKVVDDFGTTIECYARNFNEAVEIAKTWKGRKMITNFEDEIFTELRKVRDQKFFNN